MTRLLCALFSLLINSNIVWAEPQNLTLVQAEIKKYHDSGLYEEELAQKIAIAQKYIIEKAMHNNSHQPLALVLDIDETSLSNYEHIASRNFGGTREQIHQEILAADAPAIKPMLLLYNQALKNGIAVFFVTGRTESERIATQNNLKNAGYTHWSGLYLRPSTYAKPSIIPFKSEARHAIEKQGYIIVATIGDQYSDIKGGHAEKGFKLPNPFYYLP